MHAVARDCVLKTGEEVLQLLAVLGRDLQHSFFPHLPRVSSVFLVLISPPEVAPEVCGRVLRCLGFLLKFVARPLARDMSAVRCLYAPLLGHRRDFVRKMAAQSLAPTIRRLKSKAMRKHVKQLVEALAAGRAAAASTDEDTPGAARLRSDTLDGCSQLLFFVTKGVRGRLHSQVRISRGTLDGSVGSQGDPIYSKLTLFARHVTETRELVQSTSWVMIFVNRAIHPRIQAPILLRVLFESMIPKKAEAEDADAMDVGEDWDELRRNEIIKRQWCFELASAVLALVVDQVRSPNSADLWLELHYGLGTATARYRASLTVPVPPGAMGIGESAECAAVRYTADLLSQAVGHMGGILLREEAVGVKQAALLAEAFGDLTTPDLFWNTRTSPSCRRAVVELLAVALCGLHRHRRLVKSMPRIIQAVTAGDSDPADDGECGAVDAHPALALARSVLGGVGVERTYKPPPMRVTRTVALPPLLEGCAGPLSRHVNLSLEILTRVIYSSRVGLVFVGDEVGVGLAGRARGHGKSDAGVDMDDDDEDYEEEDEERSAEDSGALAVVGGSLGVGGLPVDPVKGKKV